MTADRPAEKQLPHSIDAEESVLGAMLLVVSAIEQAIASDLRPEHFYLPKHQIICEAIYQVAADGQPADAVTVGEQLRRSGMYDLIGGAVALVNLQAGTPTASNGGPYARMVIDYARRRKQIVGLTEALETARRGELVDLSLLAEEPLRSRSLSLRRVSDHLANPPDRKGEIVESLIRGGELVGIAAARGIGKSWAAMDLASAVAAGKGKWLDRFCVQANDRPVLYWHGEMDAEASFDRWTLLHSDGVVSDRLFEFDDPWRISTVKVLTQNGNQRSEEVRAIFDRHVKQLLCELHPALFVIDPWRAVNGGAENDNDAMDASLAELLVVARQNDTAVVLVHHFGKGDVTTRLDPEDGWRGASVLADRVHTRITVMPHFSSPGKVLTAAAEAGITDTQKARHWARRHADVSFLRRTSTSPDGMSLRWSTEDGRWHEWTDENVGNDAGRSAERLASQMVAVMADLRNRQALSPERGSSLNGIKAAVGGSKDLIVAAVEELVRRCQLGHQPPLGRGLPARYWIVSETRTDLPNE